MPETCIEAEQRTLRPLFFTRAANPVAEKIDFILSPGYLIWPKLPRMGILVAE